MKKVPRRLAERISGVVFMALVLLAPPLRAQTPPNPQLERAVATLRNIKEEELSEAEKEKKAIEINRAWTVIKDAGRAGISRLKEEVRRVDASKERDDFFKLSASAIIWISGRLGEAESIAAIWNSTPLEAQYRYVFYAAMDAAKAQDLKALPMLKALLRDKKGELFFDVHSMEVKWPLTHEFVWGTLGPKGLPALAEIINTSKDPVEVASAILLLAKAQYLPALPRIREIAASGQGEARLVAIQSLGVFGHPQDYDFLINGLRSEDADVAWRHVYALYEYGDLRAVPHLIPLLETKNSALEQETAAALAYLMTPASLEALQKHSQTAGGAQVKEEIDRLIREFLQMVNLGWEQYLKMSAGEREQLVTSFRDRREASKYKLGEGEKAYTHDALVRAAAGWKRAHRMGSVTASEILSGATAGDIEMLLDVKSTFYTRLSDEALYEVNEIDEAVKYLGRGRYRKVAGITARVKGI